MKKQGIDIVSLSSSEPEFDMMWHIKEAAKKAIDEGFTKYTTPSGISELKAAVAAKFRRDNWLDYDIKEISISNGSNQSVFNIIMTLIDSTDEVVIPVPYWNSYREMVNIAQGKVVFLETNNFKIDPEKLQQAISTKTKLLILNTPGNPSGVVYDEKELKQIAFICIKNNIFVLSDELYEVLTYDKKHISIATINDKIKKLTIVINGLSISHAMTGLRIGYAAGREEIISAARRLQDHSTSNASSISQKAAIAALTGPQEHFGKMVKEYRRRRDFMVDRLNRIKGIFAQRPDGAFYVFANISHLYNDEIKGSKIFCERLLEEAFVAVVPGVVFGDDRCIRLSFTTSTINIQRGLDRMEKFCEKIRK